MSQNAMACICQDSTQLEQLVSSGAVIPRLCVAQRRGLRQQTPISCLQSRQTINLAIPMHARYSTDVELWGRIQEVYRAATSLGAAQGITTTQTIVQDSELGINFILYVAEALKHKPTSPQGTGCVLFETCSNTRVHAEPVHSARATHVLPNIGTWLFFRCRINRFSMESRLRCAGVRQVCRDTPTIARNRCADPAVQRIHFSRMMSSYGCSTSVTHTHYC
jgi:hypothetical protein